MRHAPGAALLLLAAVATGAQAPAPRGQPVDGLLSALKAAPNEEAAAALEAQIQGRWAAAATPAVKLLLSRAARELSEGSPGDSLDSFDAALDLQPDLLEGWRGRARARLRMGDPAGAARDIQEALRREPRNFMAWQDLSRIAEAKGDWRGAAAAWQKMLDIDPRSPGGQNRLKELRRKVNGEDA